MLTASSIVTVAAEKVDHLAIALHTLPYGLIALGVFGVLALVTASYSNVANRHSDRAEHHDDDKH